MFPCHVFVQRELGLYLLTTKCAFKGSGSYQIFLLWMLSSSVTSKFVLVHKLFITKLTFEDFSLVGNVMNHDVPFNRLFVSQHFPAYVARASDVHMDDVHMLKHSLLFSKGSIAFFIWAWK